MKEYNNYGELVVELLRDNNTIALYGSGNKKIYRICCQCFEYNNVPMLYVNDYTKTINGESGFQMIIDTFKRQHNQNETFGMGWELAVFFDNIETMSDKQVKSLKEVSKLIKGTDFKIILLGETNKGWKGLFELCDVDLRVENRK